MNLQENHILAPYCSFQIGGPADYFVEARSREELLEALAWTEERDMPFFVFGGGTNLLFDDAGFRGLVIRVRMKGLNVEGNVMHAEAGCTAKELVEAALEHSLTGMEAWTGLPGTVGGAVFGNAGCFEVETGDILQGAEIYMPGEGVRHMGRDFLDYSYRMSRLKREGGVVLSAMFELSAGNADEIAAKMKEVQRSRLHKQPPGLSTGSMFKNPNPEQAAGWLIDQCELKGRQIGGAKISEHHGNFFMNAGGATAADILDLVALAQREVKVKFGVDLEREVIFLAEDGVRPV